MNRPPQFSETRIQCLLFVGLMLLFLAFWKGDGGYLDLRQYLDNAENMWLKGDLSIPGQPGKYYIHPLGIAFLSGPFVLAGALIEKISGGLIGCRSIAALSIPVFSALACLLLYKIGRELKMSPRASAWGALMLALGSPLLTYSRLYFGEGGIALSLCLAGWAFLRVRRDAAGGVRWALLCGAGLAGATACHFNTVFVSAWLWVVIVAAFWRSEKISAAQRLKLIGALSAIPIIAASVLLYMNARRFGSPLSTGYEAQLMAESSHPVSLLNVPGNLQFLVRWLMRVPWIVPALGCILYKLWPRERAWAIGLSLAALTHVAFFQMYSGLHTFPVRYPQTSVIVLAVGLLLLGEMLWKKWGSRGLIYSALILVLWNAAFALSSDTSAQVFWLSPADQRLNCYVWYMTPLSGPGYGTPMGTLQWAVLLGLLSAAGVVMARVFREAKRFDFHDESGAL